MVDDAYIRLIEHNTNEEILRLELSEDACLEQSVLFGELTQTNGVWKFHALSQSFKGDLAALVTKYGAQVDTPA